MDLEPKLWTTVTHRERFTLSLQSGFLDLSICEPNGGTWVRKTMQITYKYAAGGLADACCDIVLVQLPCLTRTPPSNPHYIPVSCAF